MPSSQRTNGSNISVGGCRTVRLTTQGYDRRIVIFHHFAFLPIAGHLKIGVRCGFFALVAGSKL